MKKGHVNQSDIENDMGHGTGLTTSESSDLMYEMEGEAKDLSMTGVGADTTGSGSTSEEIKQHSMNIEKTARRTVLMALLVILVGGAAAASFLYVGITSEEDNRQDEFISRAKDFTKEIDSSWNDYETAVKWMHESCRNWREDGFSREDFYAQYKYALSGGLEFFAIQFVPNVTHEDRLAIEEDSHAYFEANPVENYTYPGFRGLEPDPEDLSELSLQYRSKQPFYFPILFVEPGRDAASLQFSLGLDLYSTPYERPTIDKALETWKPTLTPRFKLIGRDEGEDIGYTVVLYHPGIKINEDDPNEKARDLNNMLVRIHSLLERASRGQSESMGAYIYDVTQTEIDALMAPDYLGGIRVQVDGDKKNLSFYEETPFEDLVAGQDGGLIYEKRVEVGERVWKIVIVPIDDSYSPHLALVILSGCLIFCASLFLAIWMMHNMKRSIDMHRLMSKAAAEAAIVSSLFPEKVRLRLIKDAQDRNNRLGVTRRDDIFRNDGGSSAEINMKKLNSYLTSEGIFGSKPIAELHPHCTLMFADLVGFTAWSSTRDPGQVFTLLEIIYHSFDNIGKRRRVFKVESVGDCYVSVVGLPEPRKDHCVVMARFATDCLYRLQKLVKALETTLGPDTGDLACRIGLHSGPVTAGVLRGEKGRFQLFGDTVNLASRMESTGVRNKIQVSEDTADLLKEAGREKWLIPREDEVKVKGKGTMRTFFLKVINGSKSSDGNSNTSSVIVPSDKGKLAVDSNSKMERMVDWNVEVLSDLMRKIVAHNQARGKRQTKLTKIATSTGDRTVLDEVKEVILLPDFDESAALQKVDPDSIVLEKEVHDQLYKLISTLGSMYHNNPFHNFEHASHVALSVLKMSTRIVEAKQFAKQMKKKANADESTLEAGLYDFTFGLAGDPMTPFACVFAALIHDVDHLGVPNMTLISEQHPLAAKYLNKSIAEQNSLDLMWNMLQDPQYEKLMNCICYNQEDYKRFRQILINIVLATDIMDKELGAARKSRWNIAFGTEGAEQPEEPHKVSLNRKATIVLEHLIQASDVSHTMQHWAVYAKWNERLFQEMYSAYLQGRLEKDPSLGWFQGEIGFFDFYLIPLAKKLFKCGVFGVSSDEYLNYVINNRKEWEKKGQRMVEQYLIKFEELFEKDGTRRTKDNHQQIPVACGNDRHDFESRDFDDESVKIKV